MSQPPYPPPFDPNDPNTWQQNPNPQSNPYQQPNPNPYQQNPGWQQQTPFGMQRELPNATATLVLGIISIIGAFCYGFVGIVCGVIGLILGNKAVKEYEANPSAFTGNSYNNAKAGRICSIIGLILGILIGVVVVIWIIFWASFAANVARNPYRY